WLKSKQAKSVCMHSSQLMSSLENIRPGMRLRFLSQKMDVNGTREEGAFDGSEGCGGT
ncbi:hypothetical protein EV702DRAFT_985455, partial [Suillus placidus]